MDDGGAGRNTNTDLLGSGVGEGADDGPLAPSPLPCIPRRRHVMRLFGGELNGRPTRSPGDLFHATFLQAGHAGVVEPESGRLKNQSGKNQADRWGCPSQYQVRRCKLCLRVDDRLPFLLIKIGR